MGIRMVLLSLAILMASNNSLAETVYNCDGPDFYKKTQSISPQIESPCSTSQVIINEQERKLTIVIDTSTIIVKKYSIINWTYPSEAGNVPDVVFNLEDENKYHVRLEVWSNYGTPFYYFFRFYNLYIKELHSYCYNSEYVEFITFDDFESLD